MTYRSFNIFILLLATICFGLSCSSGDSELGATDGDAEQEPSIDGDTDSDGEMMAGDEDEELKEQGRLDAVTSATPGVADVVLNETHGGGEGWKKAQCFSCHENVHRNGQREPECIHCHGNNGAGDRAVGHANTGCRNCHDESHSDSTFADPKDCTACHKYVSGVDCPVTEEYDVVVIGAGGGGLGAATSLAKAGKKVILIEKNSKVGGYMTNFKRGPYTFEISLHAMGGLDDENGSTRKTFKKLGIMDKLKPIRLDPMYKIVNPDFSMIVPADVDEYVNQLKEMFPEDAQAIQELFDFLKETDVVFQELSEAQAAGGEVWDEYFAENMGEVLKLFGYMNISLSEFLEDYFENERLHLVFTQMASYIGVDPDELSAAFYLVMWFSYHLHGFYYFEGGSQSISDAQAEVILENGGVIKLNTLVEEIIVENGRVSEVRTKDDACYRTRQVVSNASARATMLKMIGPEHLPTDYVTNLENMKIGISAIALYLGVDHDYRAEFEGAHEFFVNPTEDQHQNFEYAYTCNNDLNPFLLTNYSLSDPTVAPEGKNMIVIIGEVPYDWNDVWHFFDDYELYKELKNEVALKYLARAEELLPGLTEHIEVMSIATPPTLEGFSLSTKGTFFGFHCTPEQSLLNRLPQETPIKGLYLAGQWTFPGPGQSSVISSGISAAKLVLEEVDGDEDGDAEVDLDGDLISDGDTEPDEELPDGDPIE